MTRLVSAIILLSSLAQAAPPAPVGKSATWALTKIEARKIDSFEGKPAIPNLIEIELAFHYVGPDADVTAPAVRVVTAKGQPYTMARGLLSLTIEGLEHQSFIPWLQSGAEDKPIQHSLKSGAKFAGLIYYVHLPDSEPLARLKLGFGDIPPLPLTLK